MYLAHASKQEFSSVPLRVTRANENGQHGISHFSITFLSSCLLTGCFPVLLDGYKSCNKKTTSFVLLATRPFPRRDSRRNSHVRCEEKCYYFTFILVMTFSNYPIVKSLKKGMSRKGKCVIEFVTERVGQRRLTCYKYIGLDVRG